MKKYLLVYAAAESEYLIAEFNKIEDAENHRYTLAYLTNEYEYDKMKIKERT